jgi:hypothetical protein
MPRHVASLQSNDTARGGSRLGDMRAPRHMTRQGAGVIVTLVTRLQGRAGVWSPDYDGKGKAVRFDDSTDAIVGGSRVER